MSCDVGRLLIAYTWSMCAGIVSKIGRAPGLVQRGPPIDTIPEPSCDYFCIVSKSECCISIEPATFLVQRQREVPMIQGHKRGNISCQERIHSTIIKIQATPVDSS